MYVVLSKAEKHILCGKLAGTTECITLHIIMYNYVLLLYFPVQLIHVYCTETLPSFQFGI